MCEMKNTLDGINGRLDIAKQGMCALKTTATETI